MVEQTLCIRCGKPRITGKTWKEKVGIYNVTHTENICADPACQKQVDVLLKDRHDVFTHRLEESLKRRKLNAGKGAITRRAALLTKASKKHSKTAHS